MKFKYYLRGIGLGIIFTSIILAVAHSQNKGLTTDSEVIKRAMELGMIMTEKESQEEFQSEDTQEEGAEIQQPVESQKPEVSQPDNSQRPEEPSQSEESQSQEEPSQSEESQSQEETTSQSDNSESGEPEYVVITVVPGEVCRQIAEDLYAHELVDDAEAFRKYMQKNGYGNFIQVGNFPIPKGASYEEIARILTEKD